MLLSQRSARHGRPKAGRGAERAKRAERAQSAFTKNRVILTLPNTDHIKKKFFDLTQHRRHQKKFLYLPKESLPYHDHQQGV